MINLATQVAAILAHGLAWAVVVYLLFVPVYAGQRTTAVAQGQPPVITNTTTSTSSTLVEVNGLEIIPVVLVPVLLTGIRVAWSRVHQTRPGGTEGDTVGGNSAYLRVLRFGHVLGGNILFTGGRCIAGVSYIRVVANSTGGLHGDSIQTKPCRIT